MLLKARGSINYGTPYSTVLAAAAAAACIVVVLVVVVVLGTALHMYKLHDSE